MQLQIMDYNSVPISRLREEEIPDPSPQPSTLDNLSVLVPSALTLTGSNLEPH